MIAGISTALSGLAAASKRTNYTANNIANASTPGYRPYNPQNVSTNGGVTVIPNQKETAMPVDLGKEIVDLAVNETSYKANLKTLQAIDDMQGQLLDIKS